jgi:ATP-dependent RNA helicase DDX27
MQLRQILKMSPKKRQTLLFSATMTSGVQQLISLSLTRPVRLAADAEAAAPATLQQQVLRLKGGAAAADKVPVLCALCARTLRQVRTIIFCRQKRAAHRLKILLGLAGLPPASELHGDMTQVRAEPVQSQRALSE